MHGGQTCGNTFWHTFLNSRQTSEPRCVKNKNIKEDPRRKHRSNHHEEQISLDFLWWPLSTYEYLYYTPPSTLPPPTWHVTGSAGRVDSFEILPQALSDFHISDSDHCSKVKWLLRFWCTLFFGFCQRSHGHFVMAQCVRTAFFWFFFLFAVQSDSHVHRGAYVSTLPHADAGNNVRGLKMDPSEIIESEDMAMTLDV